MPDYDGLATIGAHAERCSWGLWGEGDKLGTLNLLTPERALRGVSCVRSGRAFRLDVRLDEITPPLYGRQPLRHTVLGDAGHDDVIEMNTQSATQWDGFRHVRHPDFGFYGGVDDAEHGMDHWSSRIVGRAVLADVARWRENRGAPLDPGAGDHISPQDLRDTLDAQGVTLEMGDILLIRTGWLSWYRRLDHRERAELPATLRVSGLAPTEDTLRFLWDAHVAAVAADNPSLETWPATSWTPEHAIHFQLLCLLGIPIGELFDLDSLADDCAEDGRYEAFITSAPLVVRSGVASPPGAICVK